MDTALLFSGQGSQYVGMLKDIAELHPQALELVKRADTLLGYSLSEIMFGGPAETLKETRYTQPALFLHSAVIYELVKGKIEFSAVAGHSVGEYAALYSAGVLSFDTALKLVSLRGELMFKAGENMPGTMFAVLGLDDAIVERVCNDLTEKNPGNVVVAANYNSPGQIVVSGSAQFLRENALIFKTAGAKLVKELVVSGAFHSPLMQPAKEELEKAINSANFSDAKVPVYSNVFAKPVTKADELKSALVLQLTSPVRWTQSMLAMKSAGIARYIELGAGQVLQGLAKRTLTDIEVLGADKASELEKILL